MFAVKESEHRIHDPLSPVKMRVLGEALRLPPAARLLDLACGSGEMLCAWARDHQVTGLGVDLCEPFVEKARQRADELAVADKVRFVHADAAGFVSAEPVDVAACVGATWIGDGVPGTIELLRRSLRPGGMMLVGEPFWRRTPPDDETARRCEAADRTTWLSLGGLVDGFGELGCDVVEMMLSDQDDWDRYIAQQWLTTRRWLDANPDHELAADLRAELTRGPSDHVRYQREYLGWGIFALMDR
jgi:SAM-dependent methyltransferase